MDPSQIGIFLEIVKEHKIRVIKPTELTPSKTHNSKVPSKCGNAEIYQNVLDGNVVDVKEFIYNKINWTRLCNETILLATCTHDNIPKFQGVVIEDANYGEKKIKIVSEHIEGRTLNEYSAKQFEFFSEDEKLKLVKDLCNIIVFIHDLNFIHRDLKPENLNIDKNKKVYLIDFGTGKVLEDDNDTTTKTCGSMNYIPPESVEGDIDSDEETGKKELINTVSAKYDVWAFGCIVSYLFTGEIPWNTTSELVILPKLKSKTPFIFKKKLIKNEKIIDIIQMATEPLSEKRCEMKAIKAILDKM